MKPCSNLTIYRRRFRVLDPQGQTVNAPGDPQPRYYGNGMLTLQDILPTEWINWPL